MRTILIALLCALATPAIAAMTAEELAANMAQADEALAGMAMQREQSRQKIRDRASDACDRLWRKNADAAILNPICFEIFLSSGLPD